MKPKALTIGTISRVPRVTANAFEASRRRQMATPVSSSPCRAALTNRVGPSRLPWMTETGSAIGVRLAKALIGRLMRRRSPGATSSSPIVKAPRAKSALSLGFRLSRHRTCFDKLDDLAGDVDPRRPLDTLEAWRGVHLHHHRPVVRPQHVDAAHIEPHRPGRADRRRPLLRRDLDRLRRTAPMKIGAEIALAPTDRKSTRLNSSH